MKAFFKEHQLKFKFSAGTSRGVLNEKTTYYLVLEHNGVVGIGECSTIPGLSIDSGENYTLKLDEFCHILNQGTIPGLGVVRDYPSIAFGYETALRDLNQGGQRILYPGEFTDGKLGIPINGLVWMGERGFMERQIREKIDAGFRCIKLKIGALDFLTELDILAGIRRQFSENDLELRVDANGAFKTSDALEKLKKLSEFRLHSIEQPIRQGQYEAMAEVCEKSPVPVALDEELIGISTHQEREHLLAAVRPQYIILKPSLIGGIEAANAWIDLAAKLNIGWWVTSALESNIGLNAIAQWTASLNTTLPQGLGTGQIYHHNISSPLTIRDARLFYVPGSPWDLKPLHHD